VSSDRRDDEQNPETSPPVAPDSVRAESSQPPPAPVTSNSPPSPEDQPQRAPELQPIQQQPDSEIPSEAIPDEEVPEEDIEDEEEEEEFTGHVEPIEEAEAEPPPEEMEFRWYILKVQVNREDSIREALQRRISRAGLDAYFGEIIVPTEDVVEFNKSGKKRTVKRKLYPGYIIVNMGLTEETWFLVRETPGIGDFTGSAGKPTPMDPDEVRRIVKTKDQETEGTEEVRIAIPFNVGDRVRVKEGYFQNFEGDVESIDQANGRVTVMINIFGRSTPVELQHWQMERV